MNMQPKNKPAQPVMSERRVGLIGAMLVALGPLSMALYTPAMPQIVQAFDTSEAAVKLTLSLYFAGFAFAQLFCGPLSDGFGRKPVITAFMLVYIGASVFAILAPTVEFLIAARFLQGVGAAVGVAIARAVVRDVFSFDRSARVMNLIGLMLGIAPAASPTLGGITMELFGWHAIFLVMLILGVVILVAVQMLLVETIGRDLSRIRPAALVASYRSLFTNGYFLSASLVLGCSIGAIYTQATLLPFILMDRVGLSPAQFGAGMLMQSGGYFVGGLAVRVLMGRFGVFRILPVGLGCIAIGSLALAVVLRMGEPSFLLVMGPVAIYSFGNAFVMPAMSTAAVAPFPHIAGAAASLSGFMQMGGGLVGGTLAALSGDPVSAMATIIPAMGLLSIGFWLWWRRLPEPALARVTAAARAADETPPAE